MSKLYKDAAELRSALLRCTNFYLGETPWACNSIKAEFPPLGSLFDWIDNYYDAVEAAQDSISTLAFQLLTQAGLELQNRDRDEANLLLGRAKELLVTGYLSPHPRASSIR